MRNYSLKIIRFSEDKLIPRAYTLGEIASLDFMERNEYFMMFFPDSTFIAEGSENSCCIDWDTIKNSSDYYFVHSHSSGSIYPSPEDYLEIAELSPTYDNFIFTDKGLTQYINLSMYEWASVFKEADAAYIKMLVELADSSSEEDIKIIAKLIEAHFKKVYKSENKKDSETFIYWTELLDNYSPDITMFEVLRNFQNINIKIKKEVSQIPHTVGDLLKWAQWFKRTSGLF